ncbi:MAG TPA: AAA family ATPase, partial [Stenomitos sp.]
LQDAVQALQAAQAQRQQLAVLPLQRQQLHDLTQEMQQLQTEMQGCDRQLAQIPTLQTTLQEIETQLQQLQDPKGHLKVLQQQLRQREQLQVRLTQLQQNRDQILQKLAQIDEQWSAFAELDTQFEAQQAQMQTHNTDYQQYLRHREQANSFRQIGPQKEQVQAEIAQMQEELQRLKAQLQQVQQDYDPQDFLTLNEQLAQLKQTRDQLQGGLSPKQAQLRDLEKQLKARTDIAQQQERDRSLLGQKQQMLQFIGDARHIFNQSGPRITRYYLAEVSLTADKLFRELLNRDEVTLEWTEDYEIRVKERGYWRSFKSLSGGEQMCAALAVRLALLRVLADIDIAFFDEPTTNMDQQRRQQLAEAISNLKAFRQLIVISHDDTFETVTEHSIRVERQPV